MSDYSYYPAKALDLKDKYPMAFKELSSCETYKKLFITKKLLRVCGDQARPDVALCKDRPLDYALELMDKYAVREQVESQELYWDGDIGLKIFGLLPTWYQIRQMAEEEEDSGEEDFDSDDDEDYRVRALASSKRRKERRRKDKLLRDIMAGDKAAQEHPGLSDLLKEVAQEDSIKARVFVETMREKEREKKEGKYKPQQQAPEQQPKPPKKNSQSVFQEVPKACACDVCRDKEYLEERMLAAVDEGDQSLESREWAVQKVKSMKMGLLKRVRVDRWYDLVYNREVIEYCQFHKIEADNHQIIAEVKKRMVGIDWNPRVILAPHPWQEIKHNNWFMPDIDKKMVAKSSFPIMEGRAGNSYINSTMDKLPLRIEQIALSRINQSKDTDKRFCDMSWEVRRKRLCLYYYKWFGLVSYHPQMFESAYSICLMRIARKMKSSLEVRLFSMGRDMFYLGEMRGDLYRLWSIKEKNWGQKDVVANYYINAAAYMRQVFLECQILVIEYGDQVRDKMPKSFKWLTLKPTKPGKWNTNYTLKAADCPCWVDRNIFGKIKAQRNRCTPLEDIMTGKLDHEADEIWTDDPYFMDPEALYKNRDNAFKQWPIRRKFDAFRRRVHRNDKVEKEFAFTEHQGPIDTVGFNFKRLYIVFNRPVQKYIKKNKKPTAANFYDEAIAMMRYDKDEIKSINDLPELRIAYTDLVEELRYNTDFPIKDENIDLYWNKLHIQDVGPPDHTAPVIRLSHKQPSGKERITYVVNRTTLKAMIRTEEYRAIYKGVKWYYHMLQAYRRDRKVRSAVYDDMIRLVGHSHVEERYHLGRDKEDNIDQVIFKEFDDSPVKTRRKCKYLDDIVRGSLENIELLTNTPHLNKRMVYQCIGYYYLTTKRIMKERQTKWIADPTDEVMRRLNTMFLRYNDAAREVKQFEAKIKEPADVIVRRFIKNIASQDPVNIRVLHYPPDYC
ncbi:hypothetical protein GGF37_000981 [Kickxella alabastrina]|nr:hypothetical protein GGF37_000981 [Kickxella alabastrina]